MAAESTAVQSAEQELQTPEKKTRLAGQAAKAMKKLANMVLGMFRSDRSSGESVPVGA
jgi:hypothetical protein